jgi:putative flippase GtrA
MNEYLLNSHSQENLRFARFMLVGIGGTLLDFLLLSILIFLGMPTIAANTSSYLAGVINNFLLNRFWTFPEARSRDWKKQFLLFLAVNAMGLMLSNLLIGSFEPVFTVWFGRWDVIPAKIVATGIVFFWNYFANRFWTFRPVLVEVQHSPFMLR